MCFYKVFVYYLAKNVTVDGHTEVTYTPWVKLNTDDSNTDYWTYDGR